MQSWMEREDTIKYYTIIYAAEEEEENIIIIQGTTNKQIICNKTNIESILFIMKTNND